MNVAARLTAFAVALMVLFAGATAVGRAVDPVHDEVAGAMGDHGEGHGDGGTGGHAGTTPAAAGGLAVTDGDLRLDLERTVLSAVEAQPLRFRILDGGGEAVTDFDPEQGGVELHLVVVGRDLSGFQHLHPDMAADGTWSIPLALGSPGAHRAIVDVTVGGQPHTLGVDLFAPGEVTPQPLPAPAGTARADGYQVTFDDPGLAAGASARLAFSVSRDGAPVGDLQPYLDAAGHLVALRQGDLAYLHLHPQDEPDGATIEFEGAFPSPGLYRLFLQFRHEGSVHTVPFTVEVSR